MAAKKNIVASGSGAHAPRRKGVAGQKVPRKMYPYVRADQQKGGLAPDMGRLINSQSAALEQQGNKPGALNNRNEMTRGKASGSLRKAWTRASGKATGASRILRVMDSRGVSRSTAKSIIAGAHTVSFGQDPFSK